MLIAYSTMALLFCRQHTKPLDINLLGHFYRVLHMGLNSGKEPIIWEIISSARNIFSLNLAGAAVLIPDFLREIDRLFNSALLQNTPPEMEKNALTIVNSLICYPRHFDGMEIPFSIGTVCTIASSYSCSHLIQSESKLTSTEVGAALVILTNIN